MPDNIRKKYTYFLAKIKNCKHLHAITYRNGKILNKTAKELASQPTSLPLSEKVVKFIIDQDKDKYINYVGNSHHWTTEYCWNTAIPQIFSGFGLNLDKTQFNLIKFIWNNCDFSYHQQLKEMKFEVEDFVTKNKISGGHDVLRNINLCPKLQYSYSLYHMLFRLAHTSGIIKNLSINQDLRLAINCDSMAIPIIPVLVPFFKEILVIDRRTKENPRYWQKILAFKPTHYLALFTEYNFLVEFKQYKNLFDGTEKF